MISNLVFLFQVFRLRYAIQLVSIHGVYSFKLHLKSHEIGQIGEIKVKGANLHENADNEIKMLE